MLKNTIPLVLSVDRTGALYMNIGVAIRRRPWAPTQWPPGRGRAAAQPGFAGAVKADNRVEYG